MKVSRITIINLGEDTSSHGGSVFTSQMFEDYQQSLERNLKGNNDEDIRDGLSRNDSQFETIFNETKMGTDDSKPPIPGTLSHTTPNNFVERVSLSGTTMHETAASFKPCLLEMPGGRAFINKGDGNIDPQDMNSVLRSVPPDSWIAPYIIAGSILLTERKLSAKGLTNISFQQVVKHINVNIVDALTIVCR